RSFSNYQIPARRTPALAEPLPLLAGLPATEPALSRKAAPTLTRRACLSWTLRGPRFNARGTRRCQSDAALHANLPVFDRSRIMKLTLKGSVVSAAAVKTAKALTLVTLVALTAQTSMAQQRVTGTVIDRNSGRPVSASKVTLEGDLLQTERTTTTDAKGLFSLSVLSPGSYTLTVSADRFYAERLTFSLAPRATQQVRIELAPVAAVAEEVTVRAEPKVVNDTESATTTTITFMQISSLPTGRKIHLTDIITPFVGSAVGSHDNLVHLRGNELSLNNFINGVSFFDNPHQLFTPGLSPDIIQSVNIITGGFPAEFGNRFGGILDIVTRTGFDANNHGSVTIGAGDYVRDNASMDFGGHSERLGYFLYAQAFQSDRFLNTPEPQRFHDRGRGSRSFAQLDYRPG